MTQLKVNPKIRRLTLSPPESEPRCSTSTARFLRRRRVPRLRVRGRAGASSCRGVMNTPRRSRGRCLAEHTGKAWVRPLRQDKGFRNPLRSVSTSRRKLSDLRPTERGDR
jgi:hypothetical protein